MLNVMFDVPDSDIQTVVIDADAVNGTKSPVYHRTPVVTQEPAIKDSKSSG